MSLTDRQQDILIAVVTEYVKTANPVGSKELVKRYEFPYSSATLRSEMSFLEEEGYLYQPHISAGRIPTDKAYRLFVNYLGKRRATEIRLEEQKRLEEELIKLQVREKMMARALAKLLSVFSRNLAIAGLLEEKEFFESGINKLFTQPDFQNIDEICRMAEFVDYLDENIERLIHKTQPNEIKTFIGKESGISESGNVSIVISQCTLPEGEKGIIAILGPKRMEYQRNISIIRHVTKFLDEKHGRRKKKE